MSTTEIQPRILPEVAQVMNQPGAGVTEEKARQTMTIPEVAEALGISTWLAYEAAKRNELPVPVLRVGRRLLVSRAALERALLGESRPAVNTDVAAGQR